MSDIHALSGAYAVDALDDLERARFEQHLAECADCRAEVASLQEAAGRMADTVAAPAPASLRDRVLADVAQVRPLPPVVPPTAAGQRTPRPTSRARRVVPLLVAAVLVVVAGLGVAAWQPWATDAPPAMSATDRVLAADDAQRMSVEMAGGARATVVRSVSEQRAVLLTEGMPPPPQGKVYEVWLQMPEDDMVPAGLMPADADRMLLKGDAAEATAAGITVEPGPDGSPKPTSEPIALFDFASG
jgi:anti-sigma factor RsiW